MNMRALIASCLVAPVTSCVCDHTRIPFPELDALTVPSVVPAVFDWCQFHRAVTLNHDLTDWLDIATATDRPAGCVEGELLLGLYEILSLINAGEINSILALYASGPYRRVAELLRQTSPRAIVESGWTEMLTVLAVLQNTNSRREPSFCPLAAVIVNRQVDPANLPPDIKSALYENSGCALETLVVEAAEATSTGVVQSDKLVSSFPDLTVILSSELPVFDVLSTLRFPAKVDVDLKRTTDWMPDNVPSTEIEKAFVRISLLPFREMASEYVRFTKQPFCSTHQFRTFMNKLVLTDVTHVNIVEGGPNLGDCGLMAAGLLNARNKTSSLVFVEPLPQAAPVITQSIEDNGFDGYVISRGLSDSSESTFKLAYFPGRDGQATDLGIYADCVSTGLCTVLDIPNISVTDFWNRDETLHILKLSTNGAELKTLLGARDLLNAGRICTVFMHLKNLWKGMYYGGSKDKHYASSLWQVLSEADMNILFYEDFDMRYPAAVIITSATQLEAAIDRPDLLTHFVTAHTTRGPFCDEFLTHAKFD